MTLKERLMVIGGGLYMAGLSYLLSKSVYEALLDAGRTPPIPIIMGIMAGVALFALYPVILVWAYALQKQK